MLDQNGKNQALFDVDDKEELSGFSQGSTNDYALELEEEVTMADELADDIVVSDRFPLK